MSKAPQKQEVSVKIEDSYLDLSYTDIDSAIRDLTEARDKFTAEGWTKLNLQYVGDCGCYGNCSCSERLRLFGTRLETDDEFAKRVEREMKHAADREARDRAEFERLSKQFGKP